MSFCNRGFISNLNEIIKGPAWSDDGLFKLYLFCLVRSSRNEYIWRGIRLHPGDMPLSERNLAFELGWSRNKLLRKMKQLQDSGLATVTSFPSVGTLIHINCRTQNEAGADGCECSATIPPWPQNETEGGSTLTPNPNKEKNNIYTVSNNEPPGFSRIWFAYPVHRRNQRDVAAALFARAMMCGATIQAFMDALNADKKSSVWLHNNGQYVPGIVKWLQREGWRDYVRQGKAIEEDEEWTSR